MQAALAVGGPRGQLRNTPTGCSLDVTPLAGGEPSEVRSAVSAAEGFSVQLYPNPASDRFVVEVRSDAPASMATVRVFNDLGAEVYRTETPLAPGLPAQCTVESGQWGAGLYVVSVQQGTRNAVKVVTVGR